MNLFRAQAALAEKHPVIALVAVAVLTVTFGVGLGLTESAGDQVDTFLPESNDAARAGATISATFEGAAQGESIQVIARGDVLAPAALQGVIDAMDVAASDADVRPLLAAEQPVSSYAHAIQQLLGETPVGDASAADIASTVTAAAASDGPSAQLAAAVDAQVARDAAGEAIAGIGSITLADVDDMDDVEAASFAAESAVASAEIADVDVRTFSNAKLNQEINDSQGSTTSLLMGLALLVIIALLVLFYRSGSDVLLSLGGLVITIVWVFGLQGLLGPGGIGVIGASNPMAIMIPVLLIGLTVDFALQITGRYREALESGASSRRAISEAVQHTGLPLLLAAGTTAISFFTNITNALPPMQDFGILAGLGVLGGFVVMTTLVPAGRTLVDQRRERSGKQLRATPMAESIPGAAALLTRVAAAVVRRPVPILLATIVVTAVASVGAMNIDTTFSTTDFLPGDTESSEDLEFLESSFGGGSSSATVLIEGPIDDRLVRDVVDFETALSDPSQRPAGVVSAPTASVLSLVTDYATDSGLPGDRFDAEFAQYVAELDLGFVVPPEVFGDLFDRVADVDGDALRRVLAVDVTGVARTVITVPTTAGDQEQTNQLVDDLESLWRGDVSQFTVTGPKILEVSIVDELVSSQASGIVLTVLAALVVLVLYFGIADFRPVLGVLAVVPIGIVVVLVLGTMAALGISYNVITALITALTIGVGVDYTVHITHRFLEELQQVGGDVNDAMSRTMRTTGAALVGSALTTALGFGVLLFSPLAPMQQFGLLTAVTIVYSLLAAFLVLPPMLALWAVYHRWRASQDGLAHAAVLTGPEPIGSTPA